MEVEVTRLAMEVEVRELQSTDEHLDELAEMLIQVVEGGASIGFLPPLQRYEATKYWENVISPEVILFVAKINNEIAGTVQLHLCTKQNGDHRAEIAKLMTHPNHRRNGVARLLMQQAEARAKQEARSLLVLDTREGDPSNLLYSSMGYIQAGRIPHFAKSATGELDATVIYYKTL